MKGDIEAHIIDEFHQAGRPSEDKHAGVAVIMAGEQPRIGSGPAPSLHQPNRDEGFNEVIAIQ